MIIIIIIIIIYTYIYQIMLYFIILTKEVGYHQILSHRLLHEIELRNRWQPGFRPEMFRA